MAQMGCQLGVDCAPPGTFEVIANWGSEGGVLLTLTGERPWMLLSAPQRTGGWRTTQPSVHGAEAEKPGKENRRVKRKMDRPATVPFSYISRSFPFFPKYLLPHLLS